MKRRVKHGPWLGFVPQYAIGPSFQYVTPWGLAHLPHIYWSVGAMQRDAARIGPDVGRGFYYTRATTFDVERAAHAAKIRQIRVLEAVR